MLNRRRFLMGVGGGLLSAHPLLRANQQITAPVGKGMAHFPAIAQSCIFIFMAGGMSHIDLFDPKPKLKGLHGKMPETAFGREPAPWMESTALKASPFAFKRYGECEMALSELLPHIGSCADDLCMIRSMQASQMNHLPAQLEMTAGAATLNRPTIGEWIYQTLGSDSPHGLVTITETKDLRGEMAQTLDAYGVNRPEGPARLFASNCLQARRMVEQGARFLNLRFDGWDHHADLERQLPKSAAIIDQPIGALIKDLKQRSLLDSTLVVCATEFGRSPLGNSGRDHHPQAFSIFLAGGGTRGAMEFGTTDELGWNILRHPVTIGDLHATIFYLFGLDHTRLVQKTPRGEIRPTLDGSQVISDWLKCDC